MTITKRINQFIKEAAALAMQKETDEPLGLTMEQCIAEYTAQILEDDYYCVVNWAHSEGITIPVKLRSVIDSDY